MTALVFNKGPKACSIQMCVHESQAVYCATEDGVCLSVDQREKNENNHKDKTVSMYRSQILCGVHAVN